MSDPRTEAEDRIRTGERRQLVRRFREVAGAVADEFAAVVEENEELRRQLAEARGVSAQTEQVKPLVVLIDSTLGRDEAKYFSGNTPFKAAIEAVSSLSDSGINTKAVFWGRSILRPTDIKDAADVERQSRRTEPFYYFSPVADLLKSRTPASPDHFVIISSGHLPADAARENLSGVVAAVLRERPEVTVDIVVLDNRFKVSIDPSLSMGPFAVALERSFPGRATFWRSANDENTKRVLKMIADTRTGEPEAETSAPRRANGFRPAR